jgi:hypothetical protein
MLTQRSFCQLLSTPNKFLAWRRITPAGRAMSNARPQNDLKDPLVLSVTCSRIRRLTVRFPDEFLQLHVLQRQVENPAPEKLVTQDLRRQ